MRVPYITSPPLPIPGDSSSALSRFKYNPELNTPTTPANARPHAFNNKWTAPAADALSAAADATRAISKDILQRKNDITTKNALVSLSDELGSRLYTDDNAIFKLQGINAVNAVKTIKDFFEEAVQKHSKGLHPDAQRQFAEMAFSLRVSTQTAVGRHASAELMKAHNAADAAAIMTYQKSALFAFNDDRVFGDNRERMLDQVASTSGRLGLNREQADASLKQMDSDLQLKRGLAFLNSGNLERAEEILESGQLGSLDTEALTGKLMTAKQQQAFTLIAALPQEQRQETAQSPNKLATLGITLTESQMLPVQGKLRVLQQQELQAEQKAREQAGQNLMAQVARTALGLGPNETKPDPVAAYQLLQDADPALLDPEEKAEALAALEQGRTGQDDPAFVLEAQKLLAAGEEITNAELAKAVTCGQLSPKSLKELEKLREMAEGPRAGLLEHAFRELDKAFERAAGGAEASPELVAAHLRARSETMQAILGAKDDESAREMLDLRSSRYLVPAILERYLPGGAGEEGREPEDADAAAMRALSESLAPFLKDAGFGIIEAFNSFLALAQDIGDESTEALPDGELHASLKERFAGAERVRIPQPFPTPKTTSGVMTKDIAQFMTGFLIGNRAQAGSKAGEFVKGMRSGAFSDFFFSSGPEGDTGIGERFKRTVEGAIYGAGATAATKVVGKVGGVVAGKLGAAASEPLRKVSRVMGHSPEEFTAYVRNNKPAAVEQYIKDFGHHLDLDMARSYCGAYAESAQGALKNTLATNEPAGQLTAAVYEHLLKQPAGAGKQNVVRIGGGAGGSGKSSSLFENSAFENVLSKPHITVDTTLAGPHGLKRIDQALTAGKNVEIMFVVRDPLEAITSTFTRAEKAGRYIPLETLVNMHLSARDNIRKAMHLHAGDKRVKIYFVDNTTGAKPSGFTDAALLDRMNYENLYQRGRDALEQEYKNGTITKEIYLRILNGAN
ncbi:MAG: zeta toxin family protein [Desulfovibrionaceae bacterium]|nr:zeta toxin family protein [Desulfovibrionaceae bacterium]